MSFHELFALLLQEPSRIDALGNRFRSRGIPVDYSMNWAPLVTVALLALGAALLLVLLILIRRARNRNFHNPRRLFAELCATHELNRKQQWFLEQLGKHGGGRELVEVFVDPRLLSVDRLPPALRNHVQMMEDLKGRLFGDM